MTVAEQPPRRHRLLRLWPASLQGQVLLALALALLLAQGIGAVLRYQLSQQHRREELVNAAAFRLMGALREASQPDHGHDHDHAHDPGHDQGPPDAGHDGPPPPDSGPPPRTDEPRPLHAEWQPAFAPAPADHRWDEEEERLSHILADQGVAVADVRLARRSVADDPVSQVWLMRRWGRLGGHQAPAALGLSAPPKAPTRLLVAAIQPQKNGPWLVARVLIPPAYDAGELLYALIAQTLIIYLVLVGVMALVLRRITRPLAALEKRLIAFAEHRQADGQLPPEGPEDLRRLILAHNRMEDRIAALLDEKDVMLGAIGHDLKTPLAALRVRIESVEDDTERARMAQTIDEIARTLDDILSLARVGRPSERLEMTELSALVAQVVEDYEDMGEPVLLEEMTRLSLPVRAIWLRRALRNLIGNALRYGGGARVNLARETVAGHSTARITIEDDGPGIPEAAIAAMMEPFRRGEPSRNSLTGGAGLGLTLARAIAEQHGGSLTLANRLDGAGQIAGLVATLSLPLP